MKTLTVFIVIGLVATFFFNLPAVAAGANNAQSVAPPTPSAKMAGVFDLDEKSLLAPAFINSVTHYLRRYSPSLKESNDNSIKMTAKYGYLLDIELNILQGEYTIIVTAPGEKITNTRAQNSCARIAVGVNKAFSDYLIKGTKARDKTAPSGNR